MKTYYNKGRKDWYFCNVISFLNTYKVFRFIHFIMTFFKQLFIHFFCKKLIFYYNNIKLSKNIYKNDQCQKYKLNIENILSFFFFCWRLLTDYIKDGFILMSGLLNFFLPQLFSISCATFYFFGQVHYSVSSLQSSQLS